MTRKMKRGTIDSALLKPILETLVALNQDLIMSLDGIMRKGREERKGETQIFTKVKHAETVGGHSEFLMSDSSEGILKKWLLIA